VHGVDLAMALCQYGVLDYANPGTEEQPPGVAQSFRWQFAGKSRPFFSCQEGRAFDRNASSEEHSVSRSLAFLSNQLGFGHLAEHLTDHNWTIEAAGDLCVTATERHTQLLAGPKRVPKDIPYQRWRSAFFRKQ
jgi:hypothetical protein